MELVNIIYTGAGSEFQSYSNKDENLIISNFINSSFGEANDYIEYYIYDENGSLLDVNYDAKNYYPNQINSKNSTYSILELDPKKDINSRGYNRGKVNIQYNFLKNLFNSSQISRYWIKEISLSRTELKLSSQVLSDSSILQGFNDYQLYTSNKNYYTDFYINFGNNNLIIAINVAYTEDADGSYILIKLYEPLPQEYDIKSQLWIVDRLAESVSYDVEIQVESEEIISQNILRGPNFKIAIDKRIGQTTPYYTYDSLFSSSLASSQQKLQSYYDDKALSINVDFTNFNNFVHFSSAVQRINNFKYKLELIESYKYQINIQKSITNNSNTSTNAISSSINLLQGYIDSTIKKFDIYEYYLYYSSESFSWPKSTNTQPYVLYSVTSSKASNWLGGINIIPTQYTASILYSASFYDYTNKDLLSNIIPQYIQDDPNNQPYVNFVQMVGQHFDNIWVYYKDVTNRYNATNDPNTGISKDLVADSLKSLGFNIYTNTSVSDNLYYSLFGINQDGSLLPPTGSELITNYITSSIATISSNDIQKEIYKRLYHNLPYLLKTKGTKRGIQALINCYGIPEEILTIKEFGGTNRYLVNGIFDISSEKTKAVSSSLELSVPFLSPYATLQRYNIVNRLNTTNLEVGFSPSDKINSNISSSVGYFNIDQLIGKPLDQYSSSYGDLVKYSNNYFAPYSQSHKISEYTRLIKYYNNSLFKTIKDFVPARANLSTGIIVKSHMLERNKYARHEPNVTIGDNLFTQSIELINISAEPGNYLPSSSTQYSGFFTTSLGPIGFNSNLGVEKYTGEFGGTILPITSLNTFSDQTELSDNPSGIELNILLTETGDFIVTELEDYLSLETVHFIRVNRGALFQNVNLSVRSQRFFDLDYTANQKVPVNLGLITASISSSQVNNYATYTNPISPYAYIQDYNYYTNAFTIPRYYGSKTISNLYTDYTIGDSSFGTTAAIDKIKYQYAYLVDIYAASKFLPGRSNAQIKYVIDNNQNVLDLTKANKNIFTVQNIYKSGETTDISLFKYNEANPYTQQLANNPKLAIYEGGYRYLPILHNISGSATSQTYNLNTPIEVKIAQGSNATPSSLDFNNFDIYTITGRNFYRLDDRDEYYIPYCNFSASLKPGVSVFNSDVTLTLTGSVNGIPLFESTERIEINGSVTIKANKTSSSLSDTLYGAEVPKIYTNNMSVIINIVSANSNTTGGSGSISYSTYYTNFVTSSQPCLYYYSQSNSMVFNSTIANYYSNPFTFDSTSDPKWSGSGLNPVILPFNLSAGDKISFFTSSLSADWSENFEYTIKNSYIIGSGSYGSRLLVDLLEPFNLALANSGSGIPIDGVTGAPFKACTYIVWKHVPDETNVMLRYNPKDANLIEEGLLFPQYLDLPVKDNAGNTVKSLKQQNLIV
jgi:hypothetical protein